MILQKLVFGAQEIIFIIINVEYFVESVIQFFQDCLMNRTFKRTAVATVVFSVCVCACACVLFNLNKSILI